MKKFEDLSLESIYFIINGRNHSKQESRTRTFDLKSRALSDSC
jgi:hypothetical protein